MRNAVFSPQTPFWAAPDANSTSVCGIVDGLLQSGQSQPEKSYKKDKKCTQNE
jgi:negative regulator of replication initiation